jgi:hypothetical protein
MTIIDESGGPLPDGHPLKGLQNILGARRPAVPSSASPQQPSRSPEREPAQSREQKPQA